MQIRVIGPERDEVRKIAGEVAAVMRATPNISTVHDDWLEPAPALKLEIDQDRARALGVTSQAIRRALQAILSGRPLGDYREGEETIQVMFREPSDTRNLLSALDAVYVKTATGASVPLRQVARVRVALEPGIEWRRDRLPSVTVRGLVPDNVQSPDVAHAVYAKLRPLRERLAPGYRIELQGAVEESATSQKSINEKMPVLLVVVLVLLMAQLQHFGKTMVAFATAPLGIIGAAAALLIFQAPFGFVAILGVIALAGIIMRNSVILVDQIRQDLAAGLDQRSAIVESAVRRFRPIALTAAAAVLALVPLVSEVFWAPMALAMMGGIIAATILTLTFLPALYALCFGRTSRDVAMSPEPEPGRDLIVLPPQPRPAPAASGPIALPAPSPQPEGART
jgi:multidrug efflux pump subunit AcrB